MCVCVKGEQLHLLITTRQKTQPCRCNRHTRLHVRRLRSCRAARRRDRLNQARWMIRVKHCQGSRWTQFGKHSTHFECQSTQGLDYLYILPWYRSHQNILLVDTSTSSATAFFSVGTTCVYSLFSRSMRRISWRLVNIRYGLFPDGESKDSNITIQDCWWSWKDEKGKDFCWALTFHCHMHIRHCSWASPRQGHIDSLLLLNDGATPCNHVLPSVIMSSPSSCQSHYIIIVYCIHLHDVEYTIRHNVCLHFRLG